MICEVCQREEVRYVSDDVGIQPDGGCWREYAADGYESDGPAADCYEIGYEREKAARESAEIAALKRALAVCEDSPGKLACVERIRALIRDAAK
jgi:hypothetical protein